MVGSVILNRCGMEDFGQEINQVIHQPNQFHGVQTKHFRPTHSTRKIAEELLAGRYRIPNIIYFCSYTSKQPMDTVLIYGTHHLYGK